MSAAILAKLIAAQVDPALVAEVAAEFARLGAEEQVLERRRRKDRERKALLSAEFRGSRRNTQNSGVGVPPKERSPTPPKEITPSGSLPSVENQRAGARAREGWPVDAFERFWAEYPHKVGKADARRKLDAIQRKGRVSFETVMAGLRRYMRAKPPDRAWCNPATFLNQERWEDQPAEVGQGRAQRSSGWLEAAADVIDEGGGNAKRDDDQPGFRFGADDSFAGHGEPRGEPHRQGDGDRHPVLDLGRSGPGRFG